jgi:hypothetical protein
MPENFRPGRHASLTSGSTAISLVPSGLQRGASRRPLRPYAGSHPGKASLTSGPHEPTFTGTALEVTECYNWAE